MQNCHFYGNVKMRECSFQRATEGKVQSPHLFINVSERPMMGQDLLETARVDQRPEEAEVPPGASFLTEADKSIHQCTAQDIRRCLV